MSPLPPPLVSISSVLTPFLSSAPFPISSYYAAPTPFSSFFIGYDSIDGHPETPPDRSTLDIPDPPDVATTSSTPALTRHLALEVYRALRSSVTEGPPQNNAGTQDGYPPLEVAGTSSERLEHLFLAMGNAPARRDLSTEFAALREELPSPHLDPLTPARAASMWLSELYSQIPLASETFGGSAFLYKKVANKTRPVATTLPENFRIIRHDHPDPLADMPPLPTHPPEYAPVPRFTPERRKQMALGKGLLLPEEVKLAEWIVSTHHTAFAWTDDERGTFDPKYFAPIEIPHIAHTPWVLRQGPIPRGILSEVTQIIENKWQSGVYEPSSSSYNSRWFCVYKKDGKSLRLVHSLEPLTGGKGSNTQWVHAEHIVITVNK